MDGRNGSVYWWPRGKTIANCITCALIHACLPSRGFLASHLDLQCLPKCQVHLPAQGQVFPYDILGNRTWVEMNGRPEQNSSKAFLVSTSSSFFPSTVTLGMSHKEELPQLGRGRRRQVEQRHGQPTACIYPESKPHFCGWKPLRFESGSAQDKADS